MVRLAGPPATPPAKQPPFLLSLIVPCLRVHQANAKGRAELMSRT